MFKKKLMLGKYFYKNESRVPLYSHFDFNSFRYVSFFQVHFADATIFLIFLYLFYNCISLVDQFLNLIKNLPPIFFQIIIK